MSIFFLKERNMNMTKKGINIGDEKRRKNAKKRGVIKENQKELLRYVEYKDIKLCKSHKPWHKNKYTKKIEKGEAVQYENKIYLANGKYKFVNRKTLKIKELENVDNEELKGIYNHYKEHVK